VPVITDNKLDVPVITGKAASRLYWAVISNQYWAPGLICSPPSPNKAGPFTRCSYGSRKDLIVGIMAARGNNG
jgi:hypothetical protein